MLQIALHNSLEYLRMLMKQSKKSRDKVSLKLYGMDSAYRVVSQLIQSRDWNVWLGKSDAPKVLFDVRADVGQVPDLRIH